MLQHSLPDIETVGYIGVFILSLVGSASVLIPVPGTAAICLGPGVLNLAPIIVAIIGSIAEVIGESSGYIIGYSGKGFIDKSRFYSGIQKKMQSNGSLFIFLMCCIPNPLFDLVGIAAGSLNFPFRKFILSVWLGKLVKGITITYTCFYGFDWAIGLFGESS
tara:strand:+ start:414 stop:899 length:486 start_codon:yes stop_codon:yes gene_type:complete